MELQDGFLWQQQKIDREKGSDANVGKPEEGGGTPKNSLVARVLGLGACVLGSYLLAMPACEPNLGSIESLWLV